MRIPKRGVTYIVLSVYLLNQLTGNSIDISLNLNLTWQNIYSTLIYGLWIFGGPSVIPYGQPSALVY